MPRNLVDPRFCPVATMLLYLRLSGVEYGPIFPKMDTAHTHVIPGIPLAVATYKQWLSKVFEYTGGPLAGCTSHSVRSSAASWASRCGVHESVVQGLGCWALNSVSFRRYIQHGLAVAQRFLGSLRRTQDPVYSFWKYEVTNINTNV